MLGELKRHFRDKGWALRVPRATQELALKVSEALGTLPAKLGRVAAPARRGGGDRRVGGGRARGDGGGDGLRDHLAGRAARPGAGDDEDWTHGDALGDEDPGYELVELGEALRGTLDALPARERLILRLRFERDMTQAEIAECVGVSQMHVSRLLRRSLDRLSAVGDVAAGLKGADRRRPASREVRRPAPGDPSWVATRGLRRQNPAARPAAARRACAPARPRR